MRAPTRAAAGETSGGGGGGGGGLGATAPAGAAGPAVAGRTAVTKIIIVLGDLPPVSAAALRNGLGLCLASAPGFKLARLARSTSSIET